MTVKGGQTVSEYSTYVLTHNGTFYTTKSLPPATVTLPTSYTATPLPSSTSSTSPVVTAGATSEKGPALAFLAGVFGLMALV